MTIVLGWDPDRRSRPDRSDGQPAGRLRRHFTANRAFYRHVLPIVLVVGATRLVNLAGYPRRFVDEGTYSAQAAAVQSVGRLAWYTFFYDHLFGSWMTLAGWSAMTGALRNNEHDVIYGYRLCMVLVAMITAALMFTLARRIGMRWQFAYLALALWTFSPLAMTFSRYVLLDNFAITWVLAAMVLSLSPQRRLSAAIGGGVCMAAAVWNKETALLLMPAVAFMLVQHYWRLGELGHLLRYPELWRDSRVYPMVMWLSWSVLLMLFYPLYAWKKGELWSGPGHVSLEDAIRFQLVGRKGSGNILQAGSDARQLAENVWLSLDGWLPLAGILLLALAIWFRHLWGLWLALGLQMLMLVGRSGYLPYPQIINLLPFMALVVAGVADAFWPSRSAWRGTKRQRVGAIAGVLVVSSIAVTAIVGAGPSWALRLSYGFTAQDTLSQRQALDWVQQHISTDQRLVTDSQYWLDLRERGYANPQVVLVDKLDSDPAVKASYGGTPAGLDVLVLDRSTVDGASTGESPTLQAAIKGATVLATFGSDNQPQIQILRVNHTG